MRTQWFWAVVGWAILTGLALAQLPATRAKQSLGPNEGQLNILAWRATWKTAPPIRAPTGLRASKKKPAAR